MSLLEKASSPMYSVTELKEPEWEFHKKEAHYRVGEGYGTVIEVDPFPCYTHNKNLVISRLNSYPIQIPVDVYILHHEPLSRTNGFTGVQYNFADSTQKHYIVLSGKRTPIPYMMTRYLVAHEYGHVMQNLISEKRNDDNWFLEYAKNREVDIGEHYAKAGSWHNSPKEIFADDHRIMMAGVQSEFWPHDKVQHPRKNAYAKFFWGDRIFDELK